MKKLKGYYKNKHCKCGKSISDNAKQCGSCRCKARHGKNASNFINGESLKKHFCECGKTISYFSFKNGTQHCQVCAGINRRKPINYCICGKEINRKSKLCGSCDNKRKYKLGILNNNGDNNGRWNGGSSFEPYSLEWTAELRESIRIRDNHTCQKCGIKEKDYYRKLDVHHIDYNKQNCKENNLITTCGECNKLANVDRDYWYAYFTYIMENR